MNSKSSENVGKLFLPDCTMNSIIEFMYEPDKGVTKVYYKRYKQMFNKECNDWDDNMKTCLIF